MLSLLLVFYFVWGIALLICNCVIDGKIPRKATQIIGSIIFVLLWPIFILASFFQWDSDLDATFTTN